MVTTRAQIRRHNDSLITAASRARRGDDGEVSFHFGGTGVVSLREHIGGGYVAEGARVPSSAKVEPGVIARGRYSSDIASIHRNGHTYTEYHD